MLRWKVEGGKLTVNRRRNMVGVIGKQRRQDATDNPTATTDVSSDVGKAHSGEPHRWNARTIQSESLPELSGAAATWPLPLRHQG